MKHKTRRELRCGCPSRQLLCFFGVTDESHIYIHIKTFRSGRTTANVVAYGTTEIQCPACGRWHRFTVKADGKIEQRESLDPPAEIADVETLARTNNT